MDPIIEFTSRSLVAAEAVRQQVVAEQVFAFVVPASTTAGALVSVVREAGGDLLRNAPVIDGYKRVQVGERPKPVANSPALNIRTRLADPTLVADEVLVVRVAVIAAATGQLEVCFVRRGEERVCDR